MRLLVVYTASTPESNEAWQITTNRCEEQYRSFGSNMSTAERDVLFTHHRQEHRPAVTKPHPMQSCKTLGRGSDPISKRVGVPALVLSSAIGEKAGRWRR